MAKYSMGNQECHEIGLIGMSCRLARELNPDYCQLLAQVTANKDTNNAGELKTLIRLAKNRQCPNSVKVLKLATDRLANINS